MNSYLSKRRKHEPVKKEKKKKKPVVTEEFNDELKDYGSKKSFFQKVMDFIIGEEITEEETLEGEAPKESGKGIFDTIKGWFATDEEEEIEELEQPMIEDEIKEVLKIQNKWLLRLPKKTIKEFKDSKDYAIYKETLKKYNLIKS
jgi:hypothetical protein